MQTVSTSDAYERGNHNIYCQTVNRVDKFGGLRPFWRHRLIWWAYLQFLHNWWSFSRWNWQFSKCGITFARRGLWRRFFFFILGVESILELLEVSAEPSGHSICEFYSAFDSGAIRAKGKECCIGLPSSNGGDFVVILYWFGSSESVLAVYFLFRGVYTDVISFAPFNQKSTEPN